MKLLRGCDAAPDDSGLICRQGRLAGVISALVLGGAFVGSVVLAWWFDTKFFMVVNGIAAVVVMLFLIGDVRARFRPTNWVLWVRPHGFWINLRSMQDRSPLDTLSVVELADREIAEINRRDERYSISSGSGRTTSYKLVSLDIHLRSPDDGTLAKAIADCRKARQPWQKFLFTRGKSRPTLYSVTLPDPAVIRIAWWGGRGHGISPRLGRVLRALETRLHIGERVLEVQGSRRARAEESAAKGPVSEADARIDDQILSLVQLGNRMDAIKLLVHERGYSLTEAKRFVDELNESV